MHVWVRVWLGHRPQMRVLVVLVVHVQMLVLQWLMAMKVLMVLQRQSGHARYHQGPSDQRQQVRPISEQGDGENRADEGSGRENRRLPRRSEDAQSLHIQDQAQTVTEDSHQQRRANQSRTWKGYPGKKCNQQNAGTGTHAF